MALRWVWSALLLMAATGVAAAEDLLPLPGQTYPGDVPPDMRTPPYLPAPTPLPPFVPAPGYAPPAAPAQNFAPGLPAGPVTNYGTGGMQAMPGAPPNPPYPASGLMH